MILFKETSLLRASTTIRNRNEDQIKAPLKTNNFVSNKNFRKRGDSYLKVAKIYGIADNGNSELIFKEKEV